MYENWVFPLFILAFSSSHSLLQKTWVWDCSSLWNHHYLNSTAMQTSQPSKKREGKKKKWLEIQSPLVTVCLGI